MGVLDGKAAIVTGSARGIGRATAELLAAHGAQVLINDLDDEIAEQAGQEIDGDTAVLPVISDAACSATSPSRSLMRTSAPCATSSSAVARPMPRAEPVTIAD